MTTFEWAQSLYDEWERGIREDEARRSLERTQALREEWERSIREDEARRSREDEARELLVHQVSQRFGDIPDHVAARIQGADHETLRRWATQVLTARSLDDVLQ